MSIPTMADHHRDAVRYPACNCGAVWKQRGNRTGHCTRCHETYEGVSLFDWHQTTDEHGRTHCKEPRIAKYRGALLDRVDNVWRGPRTDEAARARLRATRTPTDQPRHTRHSDETASRARSDSAAPPDPADGRTA